MTTASKKVAFIGCSHFAGLEQETQGKNNWTFQLSQKFPQHEYRNYSKGGQGIQGYELALLDAKMWGADIIFLNRTYLGRWQIQFDIQGHDFEFELTNRIGDNWTEWLGGYSFMWGSANSGPEPHWGPKDSMEDIEFHDIVNYFKKNKNFWRVQYNNNHWRTDWELKWYANVEKLYNFEHIFLIDWTRYSHQVTDENGIDQPTLSSTTWDVDVETYFTQGTGHTNIGELGITISKIDQHLNPHGNKRLLEEYILANHKVKSALTT
jgi:hypothetical protein